MKKLRWQLVIIFLTGLVVGILLLGEQPAPQQVSNTPEPEKGGAYTEALIGSMQRLNPLLDYTNPADRDINRLLYSRLVSFDSRGLPQSDLAAAWAVSKDGTVYHVSLQNGARWHDGQPLTADDVVFTIGLFKQGGSLIPADIQAFWKDVEVQALDPQNLEFKLPEPYAPFVDYLAFDILPKHIFANQSPDDIANDTKNLSPVGSGPYRFDRLIVEDGKIAGVALVAYDGYYGQKPFIQQINFRYYPDGASAYQAYQDGTVQGISQVPQDILPAVLADTGLSVYSARLPELAMILFNHNDSQATFLKDANVRRALMFGLNRQGIVDHVLGGQAVTADSPIFPGTWAYYEGNESFQFDQVQAKALLKTAGFVPASGTDNTMTKGTTTLTFELIYPDEPVSAAVAKSIQADWNAIGVKVKLTSMTYEQLINDHLNQRAYQAALVNMNFSDSPDPDPYPFWDQAQATGGQNYTQWDNRMASEYLEQARTVNDITERIKLYRNFQVLFSQEMPAIPLYFPIYTYAVDHQVQGITIGPLYDSSDRFNFVESWYMVAKKASSTATPSAPTPTK
jgi:peptide/nickel transport system substrate-binding protein